MKMLRTIFFIALMFMMALGTSAQYQLEQDSDTSAIMMMINKADQYRFIKPDSTLILAQDALKRARAIHFARGEGLALRTIGEYNRVSGNFPEALEALFGSLRISREIHDSSMEGAALTFIGTAYVGLEEYRTGLDYLFQAYEISKQMNIGNITSFVLTNIGEAYERMNMLDSAHYFQQNAVIVAKIISSLAGRSYVLTRMGILHGRMGNYDSAFIYYRAALSVTNDVLNAGRIYSRMALLYEHLHQADSSVFYARLALVGAGRASQKTTMLEATNLLARYFRQYGRTDSMIKYLQLSATLKDSLFGPQQFRKLQLLAISEQRHIFESEQRQLQAEREKEAYRNRTRTYMLLGVLAVFLLVALLQYRNNRQKQVVNQELEKQKKEISNTLQELRATQAQLIQREKMASLGELTAGIAHEIQNPLNFVNNFSDLNAELIPEMQSELRNGNPDNAIAIADDVRANEEKINFHGRRADGIVKAMLVHSRGTGGQKESVDINLLVDEYLRLSYHGIRAKDTSFKAATRLNLDPSAGMVNLVQQDIGRVLMNLFTNAFYSVTQKKKKQGSDYEPVVSVRTTKMDNSVRIEVQDNGMGIAESIRNKIFQPFFTTKPSGEGTGLGLSLSYDIIKAHGGTLELESREGEFARFSFIIPYSS